MSKSKRVRCVAITNNATKCKRYAIFDQIYCIHHKKQLVDRADFGQQAAVHFDQEDQGPGLIEELWTLIADDFTTLELRPLLLTCKTLFRLYTSQKWYQSHTRYLWIKQYRRRPFTSRFQDDVSKEVFYIPELDEYHLDNRSRKNDQNPHPPALFVVNCYSSAREIYRSVVPRGKKKICAIEFDKSLAEIKLIIPVMRMIHRISKNGERLSTDLRNRLKINPDYIAKLEMTELAAGCLKANIPMKDLVRETAKWIISRVSIDFPHLYYDIDGCKLNFHAR